MMRPVVPDGAFMLPPGPTLGALTLDNPFILAPMEGVSDCAFRAIARGAGAALTYTEMVRAKGIARGNKSTLDLVDTFDADTPTGIQLLVTSPNELDDALGRVEELAKTSAPHFANLIAIDLNFGCPSPDVVKIGAGPAMLKRRTRLAAIFAALAAFRARTTLPIRAISAKIRLGLNAKEQEHKVYLPVVELANESLDFLVVHARHAGQRSRDRPTWSAIKEVKANAKIPVIGNGDVLSRADAERMHDETGCDGFLVARAAMRDPFVFRALTANGPALPTVDEVDAARARYDALAARFSTKEKYRAFHAENFANLARRARGLVVEDRIPRNAHLS